jgi:hypothetical protein
MPGTGRFWLDYRMSDLMCDLFGVRLGDNCFMRCVMREECEDARDSGNWTQTISSP